jgi:hypothetical protein
MIWLCATAMAGPYRPVLTKPAVVEWDVGLRDDVVLLKLSDDALGPPELPGVLVTPLFTRPAETLRLEREATDPFHARGDLSQWYRLETGPGQGAALANLLNDQPWVERASLEPDAQPPPVDLDPPTPDLSEHQGYLGAAPQGFGADRAWEWPGGDGANVAFADIEYGWDGTHEDLGTTLDVRTWGWDSGTYAYHGNGVLGVVVAQDNGYGMTGLAPGVEVVMVSPYFSEGAYNVAAAIDGAAAMLQPGDVLLIEQQSYAFGNYAPVEADAAVFDAIASAVAKGVVVIEPGGNGGLDLDAAYWEGWFDRDQQDSGAIMVGGGNAWSQANPRQWSGGSSYGSRVDVQGWYWDIASTTTGSYSPDLFYGDNDTRQAYTSQFGGTSGASPQVASVAALFQSIAVEITGGPWDPLALRRLMVQTGVPQPSNDAARNWIGPQPDLRTMLRLGLFY